MARLINNLDAQMSPIITSDWVELVPPPKYQVIIDDTENGTITSDRETAAIGEVVTLTVVADEGYELGSLSVLDSAGELIEVTEVEEGVWEFSAPGEEVNVSGEFNKSSVFNPLRLTNTGDSEATVSFEDVDESGTTLKIRSAELTWIDWNMSEITLQPGEYVEICGENQDAGGSLGQFSMTGTISASGSVMSMIYGEDTNEENQLIIPYPNAYSDMFQGCESLVTAPELLATQLANYCYSEMFIGCTSLKVAPELPATQLVRGCYSSMFEGCSSLNFVQVNFTSWEGDSTETWLDDVAAEGTFTCPAGLDTTTRGSSHVPANWTVEHAN